MYRMNRHIRTPRPLALALTTAIGLGIALGAQAQNAGSYAGQDRTQQQRIENGLKTGRINSHEAGYLERSENRLQRAEARDLRDGRLSASEKRQLNRAHDRLSRRIYNQSHDANIGHPGSANSRRMARDVQRNINQEQRIHRGVANGSLTQKEAGQLDARMGRDDRLESNAGYNSRISANEQYRIQRNENQTSRAINEQRRDNERRPPASDADDTQQQR